MKERTVCLATNLVMIFALIFSISCKKSGISGSDLSGNLDDVENVSLISGTEDVTITVNKNDRAYFSVEFYGIKPNQIIDNGVGEGWCIDWQKRIKSNNDTYSSLKLYSTSGVEQWEKLNYLLNIKDSLMEDDSAITFREIQVAIWSLRANPEFDLDKVAVGDLPPDLRTNGNPNFSYEKVREILDTVNNGYQGFNFISGTKFAVIVATPADVQTIITVVEKK